MPNHLIAAVAWRLVIVGVLVLLALGAFRLFMLERFFLYFPSTPLIATPADFGLEYQDVDLVTEDGIRIHGWYVPGPSDVTWLFLHGNAGNISHRLENIRLLHDELGVNVLIIDYRGYGRSEGRPSEQGTYRDAAAALEYLLGREDVSSDRIIYFGRSLGAAVAVELATRRTPYGLILETPWTSINDMARRLYPWFPRMLLQSSYDSLARIPGIASPVLVVHGDRDDIVPIEAGRELYEAASEPREFYVIPGATHVDTYIRGGQAYFDTLRRWIEGLAHRE